MVALVIIAPAALIGMEGNPADTRSEQVLPPLHLAAIAGDVDLIQELINAGKPTHTTDNQGNTFLHTAVLAGKGYRVFSFLHLYDRALFERLIHIPNYLGYRPSTLVDQEERNVLHRAVLDGNRELVSTLTRIDNNLIKQLDRYGYSPFWYAISGGEDQEFITILLATSTFNHDRILSEFMTALDTLPENAVPLLPWFFSAYQVNNPNTPVIESSTAIVKYLLGNIENIRSPALIRHLLFHTIQQQEDNAVELLARLLDQLNNPKQVSNDSSNDPNNTIQKFITSILRETTSPHEQRKTTILFEALILSIEYQNNAMSMHFSRRFVEALQSIQDDNTTKRLINNTLSRSAKESDMINAFAAYVTQASFLSEGDSGPSLPYLVMKAITPYAIYIILRPHSRQ